MREGNSTFKVRLPKPLWREAKALAAIKGWTVSHLIERSLLAVLASEKARQNDANHKA
jgi:hypothetical protein